MGRPPQPSATLKLHGSSVLRKKAVKERVEPAPPIGLPDIPENTPAAALDAWRKTIEHLISTPNLLTRIDGPQLERYCRYFVRWRIVEAESEAMLTKGGSFTGPLANDDLRPALRGLWAESRRLDQALKEIEGKFGMTPGDRRSIGVSPEQKPLMPQNRKPA